MASFNIHIIKKYIYSQTLTPKDNYKSYKTYLQNFIYSRLFLNSNWGAKCVCVCFLQVDTQPQQVSDNQFLFNIPEADNINHVVVFMTGQMPFPDGLGGAGKLACTVSVLKVPAIHDL